MTERLDRLLDRLYDGLEGSPLVADYQARHGIDSACILTVTDDQTAASIAHHLAPRITGKTVVEIGGGIGLLGCHLALYADRVWCIEADPSWASSFIAALYARKPRNLSFLVGAADEFVGHFQADIALFASHSGVAAMTAAAARFAPVVIDIYGEIIAAAPDRFDPLARMLREHA